MLPKTFQIQMRPFGSNLGANPYIFYLHVQTHREALDWVDRVFTGIDIEPTLRRWSTPSPVPRPGNSDPVVIIDCDHFALCRGRRDKGTSQAVDAPASEDKHRRSEEEVLRHLIKIFSHLQTDRMRFEETFHSMVRQYSERGRDWQRERAETMQDFVPKSLVWQTNVWAEYVKLQSGKQYVIPAYQPIAA